MHKILIVSVGKLVGGIEKYTLMLEKHLPNKNYELHFVVRKGSWLANNIESNHILKVKMGKSIVLSMLAVKKYVELNDIDIIHCNSNNALFISLLVKESATRKKIAVIHGDVLIDQGNKGGINRFIYEKLENWLLKNKCYKCVAVSKSLKNVLISRGIPDEKIVVIYNAVEAIEYRIKPNYYEKPIKICTVGYLLPQKNQMLLLEALNFLKNMAPQIQFICDIYGEGLEKLKLEKYITDNNLHEVRLMGFDARIRDKLNQYSLYIQPSIYESFGIAVIEAMYAGCCVVVNDVGGMKEIVNEQTGIIVSMTNEKKQLANIIKELYFNRSLIEKKAQFGQKYVVNDFSVEKMVFNYISLYQETLRKRK